MSLYTLTGARKGSPYKYNCSEAATQRDSESLAEDLIQISGYLVAIIFYNEQYKVQFWRGSIHSMKVSQKVIPYLPCDCVDCCQNSHTRREYLELRTQIFLWFMVAAVALCSMWPRATRRTVFLSATVHVFHKIMINRHRKDLCWYHQ